MRLLKNKFNIVKPFKFFQKGTLDDPQMLEEMTRATASFNADTPDGHVYRRRLYHTDRELYDRLRNPPNNNEMERYFYDRELRPDITEERISEITRRINGGERSIPFFTGESRATTVNPKWWMKIKMFFQKLFLYSDQIFPIIIFSTLITVIVSAVIAKILNIW